MKRFLTMMLAAILLLGCLPAVVLADGDARTDTISMTISGSGFTSFGGNISVSSPATITGISGVTGSTSGRIGYANGDNEVVTSVSVNVSISVPADYCGTVTASFTMDEAHKVEKNEEEGTVKNVKTSVSSGGGSATFDHSWGNWSVTTPATCHSDGEKTRVCSRNASHTETRPITERPGHNWGDWTVTTPAECNKDGEETRECQNDGCTETETRAITERPAHNWGDWDIEAATCEKDGKKTRKCQNPGCTETETEVIPKLGHDRDESLPNKGWESDKNEHWYICSECGQKHGVAKHKFNIKRDGYYWCECGRKGDKVPSSNLPVPDMGDTTPYGTYNAIVFIIAMIAVFSVYALVSKRKSVK